MSKKTTAFDKLAVSAINLAPCVIVTLLLAKYVDWRTVLAGSFLIYQLIIAITPTKRSLGMRILNIKWAKQYSVKSHIIFAILYSVSFATAVVWVVFPFDLLLINLLCVQLPMVLKTGYTLHGYLSGKMYGVRDW